jgi:uncharacterized phage protein (TIGR02220 family)
VNGYIKLHRAILENPIWTDATHEQRSILITILLLANHKEASWTFKGEKFKAKPGQFVTSLKSLAEKSGTTMQNCRTALGKFEKFEFLTNESTNKNRLITIINWDFYQGNVSEPNKQPNKQLTSNQQATNKQLTTNNNDKNNKNDNNIKDIVDFLNEKCGTNYRATTGKTVTLINARMKEGFTLDDFKKVINNKSAEWLGTDMANYLRPETLFGNKLESYLNQSQHNNKKTTSYKKVEQSINPIISQALKEFGE